MILVAGGTGFIGRAIVRELRRQNLPVTVMSHRQAQTGSLFPGLDVSVRQGDARDPASLRRAVEGVDTVISCMQFPNFPVENPRKGYTFEEVDARGNERLVAAAKDAGATRYVYLSGAGAARDAEKHWFRAKWQAEQAIAASGLRYTVFRPSWVYGPDDNALNRLVRFARSLPFVPVIGNGDQRLQPVFVDDVAKVVAQSLTLDAAANRVFEVGGPDVMTMNELLRTLMKVLGVNKPLLHAPAFLPKLAGALMSPLPNPPISPDFVDFATGDALADIGPLTATFGIRLTPLAEGLATYLTPARSATAA
jgi:uncharacterized protein YbjT (DUF2867 family)